MKLTKGKLIAAFVILCVLSGAFFLGGPVGSGENALSVQSEAEAAQAEPETAAAPAPADAETGSPEPAAQQNESEAAEEPEQAEQAVPLEKSETVLASAKPAAEPAEASEPAEEPVSAETQDEPAEEQLTCTILVSCATILDHLDRFNPDKTGILPADGVIFPATEVSFSSGESAFDVLKREMIAAKIHFEFMDVPVYKASYIEGIANIYEFDCGELSGWMYRVNGKFENYGSSLRLLEDGDVVEFIYTCDLGRDVGGFVEGG